MYLSIPITKQSIKCRVSYNESRDRKFTQKYLFFFTASLHFGVGWCGYFCGLVGFLFVCLCEFFCLYDLLVVINANVTDQEMFPCWLYCDLPIPNI